EHHWSIFHILFSFRQSNALCVSRKLSYHPDREHRYENETIRHAPTRWVRIANSDRPESETPKRFAAHIGLTGRSGRSASCRQDRRPSTGWPVDPISGARPFGTGCVSASVR